MSASQLTVLILAAGKGTRMKSRTLKLLHKAAGWPLIAHVKNMAETLGARKIAFILSPGMEDLASAVAPHHTITQSPAKGTGHAVQVGIDSLGEQDGIILVALGDNPLITQMDARGVIAALENDDTVDAAFLTARVPDPSGLGRIVIENGSLTRIVEESEASEAERRIDLINGGLVALRGDRLNAYLDQLSDKNNQGELYLTELPQLIAKAGRKTAAVETRPDHVLGVNTRAQLAAVESVLQARLRYKALNGGVTLMDPHTVFLSMDTVFAQDVVIEPNVVISTGVRLDEGVTVRAFSHLEDVHLQSGVSVGPFARIRGGAVLEENASIGNFVEVKKSRLGAGVKAAHLAYLGDADIGSKTNIGAGTITCNYDGNGKYKTEIGDDAFIGSNSTLVAPVSIGGGAYVAAGSVITQDVPEDALGLGRSRQENKAGWAARKRKKSH